MDTQQTYLVYLTYYTGTKLPQWYIGSTNLDKINKGYNGSVRSKKYKAMYDYEQINNKHLFKTRILTYHDTRKKALKEELRLQKKHNVVTNVNYYNEAFASIEGYFGRDVSGKNNGMFGRTQTKKSIEQQLQNKDYSLILQKTNNTKLNTIKDGKNLHQLGSEKAAITMTTTICENGLTIAQNRGLEISKTREKSSRRFNILKAGKIIKSDVLLKQLNAISQSLLKSTIVRPFGSRLQAQWIERGLGYLIGAYVEEIT